MIGTEGGMEPLVLGYALLAWAQIFSRRIFLMLHGSDGLKNLDATDHLAGAPTPSTPPPRDSLESFCTSHQLARTADDAAYSVMHALGLAASALFLVCATVRAVKPPPPAVDDLVRAGVVDKASQRRLRTAAAGRWGCLRFVLWAPVAYCAFDWTGQFVSLRQIPSASAAAVLYDDPQLFLWTEMCQLRQAALGLRGVAGAWSSTIAPKLVPDTEL